MLKVVRLVSALCVVSVDGEQRLEGDPASVSTFVLPHNKTPDLFLSFNKIFSAHTS